MSTKDAVKQLQEYVNVPLAELVESSTNPRKTFDEERLEELAESIRSKGILSPLLTRRVNSTSKSFRERGVIVPRSWRVCRKPRSASLFSPMRNLSKHKSSKTFSEVMCILSRKRKGFALCSKVRGPLTPSRK